MIEYLNIRPYIHISIYIDFIPESVMKEVVSIELYVIRLL